MTPDTLRDRLKALHWSQTQLAAALGVTVRSVNRWATGQTPIPSPAIAYLNRADPADAPPQKKRGRVGKPKLASAALPDLLPVDRLAEIDASLADLPDPERQELRQRLSDNGALRLPPETPYDQAVTLIALWDGISAALAERNLREALRTGALELRP